MANEIRVRSVGVAGAITDNPLTSGATTINSPGLADLPAIGSTQHAALTLFTLDADGRVTAKEIVYVTAHTAAATSATIVRGQEGTSAAAWASGSRWAHSPTSRDYLRHATARRVSGFITLNSTTWANVDTALDLTVAAQVGDVLEYSISGVWGSEAVVGALDVVTLVAGSPVNAFGQGGAENNAYSGTVGWYGPASINMPIGASSRWTVVSGDLSSGQVTVRLRYRTTTAANKVMNASVSFPLQVSLKNIGSPA